MVFLTLDIVIGGDDDGVSVVLSWMAEEWRQIKKEHGP
jgi:hypothetical protein